MSLTRAQLVAIIHAAILRQPYRIETPVGPITRSPESPAYTVSACDALRDLVSTLPPLTTERSSP